MSKQLDNSRRTGRFSRRQAFRPQAEALEVRSLLSGGSVFLTMPALTRLGAYNVTGSSFNSALVANPPTGVAADSNGNLWVTETAADTVQEVSPAGAILATVALPAGSAPEGITSGPDGNLWVALNGTNFVDQITKAGVITPFALPAGSAPEGITSASGYLWVTLNGTNFIDQISTAGVINPIALAAGTAPTGITGGPNNTVWFTETGTNQIGEITGANTAAPVLANGAVLPAAIAANYTSVGITEGPDSNIWFTMQAANAATLPRIGVINPTTLVVNSIGWQTVAAPATYVPQSITSGPDGNIWFTMRETGAGAVPGPNGNESDRIGVVNVANGTYKVNSQELPSGANFLIAANDLLPFGIADPPLRGAVSAPLTHQSNTLLALKPGGLRFF